EADESALLARVVIVADVLEIAFSRYGLDVALDTARRRSGRRFDPSLVSTFCAHAAGLLDGLGSASVWELYLHGEPEPHCQVSPALVARYAEAFARAVDLKSVWTATHSYSVGVLAAASGQAVGFEQWGVEQLRVAGWLHDLGRVAVANAIWDKPGRLNDAEYEQVRLHAYQTERLLARSPVLSSVAALAGAVHERCDGSGYPKALKSAQLGRPARLLTVCDIFCALRDSSPPPARFRRRHGGQAAH
ncbi:MAG TPA: HD domain-containing phosphohydrolase, partial [Acidimicrobiales bacterium]|nr:HD domain-containing phosphohydrolase [Acidimicrobiales bacterium]